MRPVAATQLALIGIGCLASFGIAACSGATPAAPSTQSTATPPSSASPAPTPPASAPQAQNTPVASPTAQASSPKYCDLGAGGAVDPSLVSGNTGFGAELFGELHDSAPGENVFISPLSVSVALAMLYNGASGETRQAMTETLGYEGMSPERINDANLALLQSLCALNPELALNIANSLWARQGVQFKQDFIDANREHFAAEAAVLDFDDPAAAGRINGWVSDNTNGKITQIIDRIPADMVMYLINAIYFKGAWDTQFDGKLTREMPYHLQGGGQVTVPMMLQTRYFSYQESGAFQAVKLPYKKTNVGMYVFLPKEGTSLEALVNDLSEESLGEWMGQFGNREGSVSIPRFKMEYEEKLNDALSDMGMAVAFDPDRADLSGMSDAHLYVSEVKHKAVVEVNEVGTEAAAVTSIGVAATSANPNPPFSFIADRPFLFLIRDDATGSVLFMGAVYNPAQ
ncbi:MAG: serpin family protein [SAR202 cluster bacterium]|nr:serpin family protein [SAR202 cluster bacterium]